MSVSIATNRYLGEYGALSQRRLEISDNTPRLFPRGGGGGLGVRRHNQYTCKKQAGHFLDHLKVKIPRMTLDDTAV